MNSLALPEVLDALPQFQPSLRIIRASVRRANRFLSPGFHWEICTPEHPTGKPLVMPRRKARARTA